MRAARRRLGELQECDPRMIGRRPLKQFYFSVLRWTGEETRRLRAARRQDRLIILNLHRVSPVDNPFWSPMHPRVFDELLAFVARHFHVTTFEAHRHIHPKKPSLILSFDDGYYDFIEYALPLLRARRLPANQNIIPSCVQSGRAPWIVQVYDALSTLPRRAINELDWDGFSTRLSGDDTDAKVRYGVALGRFLTLRSRQARQDIQDIWGQVNRLLARADGAGSRTRMMDLADVQRAAADGCEIGAHAFDHDAMADEPDEFLVDDVQRCASFFANTLRLPLQIYAFPNGSYRPSQIPLLWQQGIEHVLLVDEHVAQRGRRVYPRLTMHADSAVEARLRAVGATVRRVAA